MSVVDWGERCRRGLLVGALLWVGWAATVAPAAASTRAMAQAAMATRAKPTPSVKAGAAAAEPVGAIDPGQVVKSRSGLTVVRIRPLIMRSNEDLSIIMHTAHLADVVVTLTYPDGTTAVRRGRSGGQGWLAMKIPVLYQPLDRSALVTLSVAVMKGGVALDLVTATFTVLRPFTLATSTLVVAPLAVRKGQMLTVVIHSLANVRVQIKVDDPSGQSISVDGFTGTGGLFARVFPVSYDARGQSTASLGVSAWLTYGGQTRLLSQRVPLLAS